MVTPASGPVDREDLPDDLRASVERGLEQSAKGETVYLGSFAQDDDNEPVTTTPSDASAEKVTIWTITCRGCGHLLSIGARLPDDQNEDPDDNEIDVDGSPCNYPFAMQPGPHCAAGAALPLPFLWSVRTNVEVKPYAGAP